MKPFKANFYNYCLEAKPSHNSAQTHTPIQCRGWELSQWVNWPSQRRRQDSGSKVVWGSQPIHTHIKYLYCSSNKENHVSLSKFVLATASLNDTNAKEMWFKVKKSYALRNGVSVFHELIMQTHNKNVNVNTQAQLKRYCVIYLFLY